MSRRIISPLLLILSILSRVYGSQSSASKTTTPIRHWAPSWVASSAQGTVVAVSCRLEESSSNCVLLLSRSSSSSKSKLTWKPSSSPQSEWRTVKLHDSDESFFLRVRETTTENNWLVSHQTRSSWQPIGKAALCAMTGLSSDVDHVTRVVQNRLQQHQSVYDASTPPLTKWLADTIRSAAKWDGGRPYGLQALLVTPNNTNKDLSVFTVDPSGAWRHWGSGCTCIGRNAEDIRQELYDQLTEKENPANLNPLEALRVALKSLLKAIHAASVNQDNDDYDAILMWLDPSDSSSQCRVATIDPDTTMVCRDEIWQMISTKQSS